MRSLEVTPQSVDLNRFNAKPIPPHPVHPVKGLPPGFGIKAASAGCPAVWRRLVPWAGSRLAKRLDAMAVSIATTGRAIAKHLLFRRRPLPNPARVGIFHWTYFH